MSQQITIRDNLYEKLKELKQYDPEKKEDKYSFSQVIDKMIENNNLQEATITKEGRITKALAGKTILYTIKQ